MPPTEARQGFPGLVAGLPELPAESLDPFLDAAARCFARYGVGRTSVQDVAKEMGVNRTTVYRQVGTIENQALLLASRDTHRMLASLPGRVEGRFGPEALIGIIAAVVTESRAHPVLAKMLTDEPDLIGSLALSQIPQLISNARAALTPLLEIAMQTGSLARRDPGIVAEWLARLVGSLILAEPVGDLHVLLAELLLPALIPAGRE